MERSLAQAGAAVDTGLRRRRSDALQDTVGLYALVRSLADQQDPSPAIVERCRAVLRSVAEGRDQDALLEAVSLAAATAQAGAPLLDAARPLVDLLDSYAVEGKADLVALLAWRGLLEP